jgi:hypothetical protein
LGSALLVHGLRIGIQAAALGVHSNGWRAVIVSQSELFQCGHTLIKCHSHLRDLTFIYIREAVVNEK